MAAAELESNLMKSNLRVIITLFFLSIALTSQASRPVIGEIGTFEPADCPSSTGGFNVECGYVIVPADHTQAGGDTMRLAVARIRSTSPNPKPDPIFYLDGGPGGHTLSFISYYGGLFRAFLTDRDVILYDQRGVGFSSPALNCPELAEVDYTALEQDVPTEINLARFFDVAVACQQADTQQGLNYDQFTSADSAADVRDIVSALGYDQVNLFGISYGTRLALTVMRDYPAIVRAVVLDSVYPPQVDSYLELIVNTDRAFDQLFIACAESPECNGRYPDLEAQFYTLIDRLAQTPERVQYSDLYTGQSYQVMVNDELILNGLFTFLYQTNTLRRLPQIIEQAINGDYRPFLDETYSNLYFQHNYINIPMYLAVECREEIRIADPTLRPERGDDTHPALIELFETEYDYYLTACARFVTTTAPPIEAEPVISDIPTLLLAGEFDPITPPEWAEETAGYLVNGHAFTYPATGHGVFSRGGCPATMTLSFINDPAAEPDASCIAQMTPLFR